MDHLEVKANFTIDDRGSVEGIAWPYKSPDRVGDIIIKGAVNKMADDIPMLRNHDTDLLIGVWDEITETDEGLHCKGHFNETALARGTRSQIKTGRLNGLSIGFKTKASKNHGRNRVISALDLYEISILKNGMHPGARLTGVKNYDQAQAIAEAISGATAALQLRTLK